MNNKGQIMGETILWMYRFILIGIISLALVVIVGNKYGEKYDVRPMEAALLSDKIIGCIENNNLDADSLLPCLNLKNKDDYYINVSIVSFDSGFNRTMGFGNNDLKTNCDLLRGGSEFEKKDTPSCSDLNYFVLLNGEKNTARVEVDITKYDKNE